MSAYERRIIYPADTKSNYSWKFLSYGFAPFVRVYTPIYIYFVGDDTPTRRYPIVFLDFNPRPPCGNVINLRISPNENDKTEVDFTP